MNHPCVVIIGAGQSAMSAARALREFGHRGRITLVGDEPTPPYERPPLSKQFMSQDFAPTLFADAQWWTANDVALLLGASAARIDRQHKRIFLQTGDEVRYDKLVVATGGRARTASMAATMRTLNDATSLSMRLSTARSLCVIGGGFLGLEIAATARLQGIDVTVLEASARLLQAVLPPSLSEWLRAMHDRHGTRVVCDALVTQMQANCSDGFRIGTLAHGTFDSDRLVACIGMQPNVELAQDAGLAVSGGIDVDEDCRTADVDIYAIGDVASQIGPAGLRSRVESWQNAEYQGKVAAASIAGHQRPDKPVRWFWTDQYEQNIQVLGDTRDHDEVVWRGDPGDRSFSLAFLKQGRISGAVGVNAGKDIPPLRQLIATEATVGSAVLADRTRSYRDLAAAARQAVR